MLIKSMMKIKKRKRNLRKILKKNQKSKEKMERSIMKKMMKTFLQKKFKTIHKERILRVMKSLIRLRHHYSIINLLKVIGDFMKLSLNCM